MRFIHPFARAGYCVALLLVAAGCTPSISPADPTIIPMATSLKADVDAQLAQATEPFASHADAVTALEGRLQQAAAKATATPNNENAAQQWRLMAAPDQGLAGGMFARWRRDGTLSATLVTEGRKQVAEGFDLILCLERNKQSAQNCTPADGGQ